MRTMLMCCVVGLCAFFAGWFLSGRSLEPEKLETSRIGGTGGSMDGELRARLDRIEAALAEPRVSDLLSPAVRAPARDAEVVGMTEERLRALETKIDRALARSESDAKSLAGISMAKPEPDQPALARLLASGKDMEGVKRLTMGLSYQDATIEFGTPTKKRNVPDSSNQVANWLWDYPSADKVLLIQFVDGFAHTGYFAPRTALDDK